MAYLNEQIWDKISALLSDTRSGSSLSELGMKCEVCVCSHADAHRKLGNSISQTSSFEATGARTTQKQMKRQMLISKTKNN